MKNNTIQRGGSFAPPLTDELLAEYETLADTAEPEVKDAMKSILACCKVWWGLDESGPEGAYEHVATVDNKRITAVVNPLDKEIEDALWEHIPWKDELNVFCQRFDNIQADVCQRNSLRIDAWQQSAANQITSSAFPAGDFQKVWEATKDLHKLEGVVSADAMSDLLAKRKLAEKTVDDVHAAITTKSHPTIPYPVLEPTRLRDAAHHLLWCVHELDLGREPITRDTLVA